MLSRQRSVISSRHFQMLLLPLVRNQLMTSVPSIPVKVDEKDIQNGAQDILELVRPIWFTQIKTNNNGDKDNRLKFKVFTDGLSNKLVGFYVEENPEDMVIIKVFGTNTDVMIDRKAEIETMRLLHERKCGAELYATFENGICYEYVNGVTLEVSDCLDSEIFPLVAAEMAHMHSGLDKKDHEEECNNKNNNNKKNNNQMNGQSSSSSSKDINSNLNGEVDQHSSESILVSSALWDKLEQLNKLAEECLEKDSELRESLRKVGIRSGWAKEAIKELKMLLEAQNMPVTFCHNDLIPRNIVYDKKRRRVTFIDVEYAMLNYPAFDVANHFLEFAGLAEEMDYSKCPDKSFRLKWLSEYLANLRIEWNSSDEITVEVFNRWVELCTPASHLFWSLWGVYQARHSTIQFDYIKYVGIRVGEYRKCMESFREAGQL